jgi:acyl carrier protein
MHSNVQRIVLETLAELGGKAPQGGVILDARLADTGLDSLDLMEWLDVIEERCGIRVEDDFVHAGTTIADVIAFVETLVARLDG